MEQVTKNRVLYISLAILVLLNVVTIGSMWMARSHMKHMMSMGPAGPMGPGGFMGPGGVMGPGMQHNQGMERVRDGKMFLSEELNFTPEQNEKFAKLRDEHFTASRKLFEEMHNSMDDMIDLVKSNGDNKTKAEEYASQTASKQKELQILAYNHFKSIRDLCDEKQKEKFDVILKDVARHMAQQGPPPPQEKEIP